MKILRSIFAVSFACFLATAAFAGDEPEAMPVTAEHKLLETWVGSWSGKGDINPGPMGEGGPMTWTEECSWFAGGSYHVI